MDRDTIIRLAIEAKLVCDWDGGCASAWVEGHDLTPYLERFAALVAAAAVRETSAEYRLGWNDGVMMEREACAKVCEHMWHEWLDSPEENEPNKPDAEDCYKAIRRRA